MQPAGNQLQETLFTLLQIKSSHFHKADRNVRIFA